jgi:hypothetical protein
MRKDRQLPQQALECSIEHSDTGRHGFLEGLPIEIFSPHQNQIIDAEVTDDLFGQSAAR